MSDFVSREELQGIITQRLQGSRPVAWEEDISRNTLDDKPFSNQPAPSETPVEKFTSQGIFHQLKKWLDDQTIEELVANDVSPIPSDDDREGYCPGNDPHYWLSGLIDYFRINEAAMNHEISFNSFLDFGCATGRVIRHFAAQSEIQDIWGTDINRRHIRWLSEFMPMTVKPVFNHCIATLPLRDNSVDLITAFSVFTHIDTFETHWLAEIRRILSDDGMAYLTVHNEATWERLADHVDNQKNRLVQSMIQIDPTIPELLQQPMPEDRLVYRFSQSGPYRAQVFHSNDYLRRVWGRFFTIKEILPLHHGLQTVVVLTKK